MQVWPVLHPFGQPYVATDNQPYVAVGIRLYVPTRGQANGRTGKAPVIQPAGQTDVRPVIRMGKHANREIIG
ncbi:MAG: hypothetical protein LBQ31_01355 [Bacteroidales bacterium]|nr:hypothetical protein [Bacteroidales bacterium]